MLIDDVGREIDANFPFHVCTGNLADTDVAAFRDRSDAELFVRAKNLKEEYMLANVGQRASAAEVSPTASFADWEKAHEPISIDELRAKMREATKTTVFKPPVSESAEVSLTAPPVQQGLYGQRMTIPGLAADPENWFMSAADGSLSGQIDSAKLFTKRVDPDEDDELPDTEEEVKPDIIVGE